MPMPFDPNARTRPANISLNSERMVEAREAGLDLSARAEQTIAAEPHRVAQEKFEAEIAQACRAHNEYLAEYDSLGEALRAHADK